MQVCARLVASGQAHGLVSAGNTGAGMATAKMVQGMVPGVDRPALVRRFPHRLKALRWWCWTSAPTWIASPRCWRNSP